MKKHYRLNKKKFANFCGQVAVTLMGGAVGIGMLMAILMSPEW